MASDERVEFNPAHAIRLPPSGGRRPAPKRLLAAISGVVAAVLGAAPHVLHHTGPFAGAAILGGASGSILFGLAGLVAALPLLVRLRRRTGNWRIATAALAAFVVGFLLSTLVVGPALS